MRVGTARAEAPWKCTARPASTRARRAPSRMQRGARCAPRPIVPTGAAVSGHTEAAVPRTEERRHEVLSNIIGLVSGCVTFLGGFLIVWGAVSLGLAIREQQGGAQIASAISTIAGGAIIIAAAIYFGQLDTSWLPA